jgi:hypothetical protein
MNLLLLPFALWVAHAAVKAPTIELKGYFTCQSNLLLTQQKAALTCYARTQRNCQHGPVILAYERYTNYPSALPLYQIADTARLAVAPAQYLTIATCKNAQGKTTQYFVLCKQDALGKKHLRNVLRVWGVNAQEKLVELSAKAVTCLNDDFGA